VEKYSTARQAIDENIIQRMRFACWITKVTDTHSEYVILIASPRQQWLHKRVSILRYTYIACLGLLFALQIVPSDLHHYNIVPSHLHHYNIVPSDLHHYNIVPSDLHHYNCAV
jgi:hypothetical protein